MIIPIKIRYVLAVLWTAFIVFSLLSEPSGIPKFPWLTQPGVDKLIHAILFGIEALLIVWAMSQTPFRMLLAVVLIWCFVLGGLLELAQYYWIDGRSGDWSDLLADMVGSVLAILVFIKASRK